MSRIKAAAAVAAVGVVGFIAWRAYKGGTGLVASVQQAAEQAAANVTSAWRNNVSGAWDRGQQMAAGTLYTGEKAWLYSDYNYTGIDPASGTLVVAGEWYGDAEARRYEYQQRDAGAAPAATSVHGAAFGLYPSVTGSRKLSDWAANEARRKFAATDPRRLDL